MISLNLLPLQSHPKQDSLHFSPDHSLNATRNLVFKGRKVSVLAPQVDKNVEVRERNYKKLMQALQLDPDEPIPDLMLEQLSHIKNEPKSERGRIECSKCN